MKDNICYADINNCLSNDGGICTACEEFYILSGDKKKCDAKYVAGSVVPTINKVVYNPSTSQNFSNAQATCASKGMRLPLNDTELNQVKSALGISGGRYCTQSNNCSYSYNESYECVQQYCTGYALRPSGYEQYCTGYALRWIGNIAEQYCTGYALRLSGYEQYCTGYALNYHATCTRTVTIDNLSVLCIGDP